MISIFKRPFYLKLLLVIIISLIFFKVCLNDFVKWDDDFNIYENTLLSPVTFDNVLEFWKAPFLYLYIPLTYTCWAIEAFISQKIWIDKTNPLFNSTIYHIDNLVLHIINAIVIFEIIKLLLAAFFKNKNGDYSIYAFWGAFFFAAHRGVF